MKAIMILLLAISFNAYAQPGDYDLDYDGKLDRYELNQYRQEGGDVHKLRGGLYLEPDIAQPYVPERPPRNPSHSYDYEYTEY